MTGADLLDQALEPLATTLRARAAAIATAERDAADREGQRLVAQACAQAETVLAEAQRLGAADAAGLLEVERSRARRAARDVVLAARRAAYDELRRRCRVALAELVSDPGRHRRLADAVRGRLGEGATVHDHPSGGVVGVSPDGRSVDASVDALVDSALAGIDVEQLWAAP